MNCKYKVNIKDIQYNYKVSMDNIQSKYKLKIFCSGYDDSEIKEKIDTMYEAWPKVSGEGETVSLSNTVQAPITIDLKGNTSQFTTQGYSLYDFMNNTYRTEPNTEVTKLSNGYRIKNNDTTPRRIIFDNVTVDSSKSYVISFEINNPSGVRAVVGWAGVPKTVTTSEVSGKITGVFTGITSSYFSLYVSTQGATIEFTNIMVYEGTDTTKAYEPYTNGASPNPDYPQDIHVVSGDNTITISNSDNTQSKTYPINLGSMELCKIETYQDYIYKDNDNWYKHSAIGKVVMASDLGSWSNPATYQYNISGLKSQMYTTTNLQLGVCNKLRNTPSQSTDGAFRTYVANNNLDNVYNIHINQNAIRFWSTNFATLQSFKDWIDEQQPVIYYVLPTPATTEITDTTLIGQLEAIAGAEGYTGQTNISQANSDKPFIITATTLKDLSNL